MRTTGHRGLPPEYVLDAGEAAATDALAAQLSHAGLDPSRPDFHPAAAAAAERLPGGLRGFLEDFRDQRSAACVVRGLPVDDRAIGPTPTDWQAATEQRAGHKQEICVALCAMILGTAVSWPTLQAGRLVQDILPTKGDEFRQSGHGSRSLLEFHTEDGFHPDRCDYLILFGLRNPDGIGTTLASVRDVTLSPEDRRMLAAERFHIFPDDEHIRQLEERDPGHPALAEMKRARDFPPAVSVLFGDPGDPYLRIDRPFMRAVDDDPRALRALDGLMAELEAARHDVVVDPGTLLVVDNYLTVHGRQPFTPRYDGTDRWLKKVTVTGDVRRDGRPGAASPGTAALEENQCAR